MAHLIKAGRLQQVAQHPSLVCVGGVLRQLAGQGSAAMRLNPADHEEDTSNLFMNDKVKLPATAVIVSCAEGHLAVRVMHCAGRKE